MKVLVRPNAILQNSFLASFASHTVNPHLAYTCIQIALTVKTNAFFIPVLLIVNVSKLKNRQHNSIERKHLWSSSSDFCWNNEKFRPCGVFMIQRYHHKCLWFSSFKSSSETKLSLQTASLVRAGKGQGISKPQTGASPPKGISWAPAKVETEHLLLPVGGEAAGLCDKLHSFWDCCY